MAIDVQTISLTHEKLFYLCCSERGVLYDLIMYFWPFSVTLQPQSFCKLEFTNFSSARKKVRKITKILRSFGCQTIIESLQSIKCFWCYEFSKVGTSFWFIRYIYIPVRLSFCSSLSFLLSIWKEYPSFMHKLLNSTFKTDAQNSS